MKDSYLKKCSACGNEISRYTPFCRHCGHPQGSVVALWLLGFFLIMLIAFYLAMMIYCMCNVDTIRSKGKGPEDTQTQVEARANLPWAPRAR